MAAQARAAALRAKPPRAQARRGGRGRRSARARLALVPAHSNALVNAAGSGGDCASEAACRRHSPHTTAASPRRAAMASAPRPAAAAAPDAAAGCEETACRSRGDMFRAMKRMNPAAASAAHRGACALCCALQCAACLTAGRSADGVLCGLLYLPYAQGTQRRSRLSARRCARTSAEPAGR